MATNATPPAPPTNRLNPDDFAFYIEASNVHSDEIEIFGPFHGFPYLTYNWVRDTEGNHVFSYLDDGDPQLARGGDNWRDSDGCLRVDGWRRCYDSWSTALADGSPSQGNIGVEQGTFFTDIGFFIVPRALADVPKDYNDHPDSVIRHAR